MVVVYSPQRISISTPTFALFCLHHQGCVGHQPADDLPPFSLLEDTLPPFLLWQMLCRHRPVAFFEDRSRRMLYRLDWLLGVMWSWLGLWVPVNLLP